MSLSARGRGLFLGVIGILILSPDALLLRLLSRGGAEEAAVVSGRAVWTSLAALLMCWLFPWARRHFRWRPILWYGLFFAGGMTFFPLSIQRTYAANTLVLLATTPMLAAVGARLFLGERAAPQTWAAALAAGVGAAFLLAGGMEGNGVDGIGNDGAGGVGGSGSWLGDLFGLLTAVCLAGGAIVIRGSGDTAMVPGIFLGALLTSLFWAGWADWGSVWDVGGMVLLFVDGAVVVALALALIAAAARWLSPPETGLIFLLETGLGPLWVWMFLGERPPQSSLLSGVFIALVLIAHSVWALRRRGRLETAGEKLQSGLADGD